MWEVWKFMQFVLVFSTFTLEVLLCIILCFWNLCFTFHFHWFIRRNNFSETQFCFIQQFMITQLQDLTNYWYLISFVSVIILSSNVWMENLILVFQNYSTTWSINYGIHFYIVYMNVVSIVWWIVNKQWQ